MDLTLILAGIGITLTWILCGFRIDRIKDQRQAQIRAAYMYGYSRGLTQGKAITAEKERLSQERYESVRKHTEAIANDPWSTQPADLDTRSLSDKPTPTPKGNTNQKEQ